MNYRLTLMVLPAAVLMGCAGMDHDPSASAQLQALQGSNVSGTIEFVQHSHGMVKVTGQISGLKPNAEHGFHIHETGDCSSADGSSAGEHFNPHNTAHGRYAYGTQHAGDLPSLRSNSSGVANVHYETPQISLVKGNHNILDKALIVHEDADDFVSQPSGNAGARLACAVIRRQ